MGELFQSRLTSSPMNGSAKPLTLLIALLLVMIPPTVLADDSDGDGVDDSNDAFPNDPCADTDTDGDGMPDSISCPGSGGVVSYTSFEDPFTISNVYYTDTGDQSVDRYLWNNINEPHVAHNQSTGSEMGFSLYYESTGGVGLTDGDYFGTVNYTGTVGNFSQGTQGYQMSDVDGTATLTLDDVTADSMTFDVYVQGTGSGSNPNSYENADNLIIRFVGGSSTLELVNVTGATGSSNNGGFAPYMGIWTSFTSNISSLGQGNLEFEFTSNSGSESVYIDNVTFSSSSGGGTGSTTLTEDLDDDDDGWSDLDEAACNTDSLDNSSTPVDTDIDGTCNFLDNDDDGDGVDDDSDCAPLDSSESSDNDGDGICDGQDTDDDNDGSSDSTEIACGSDPMDGSSIPTDTDNDGICDALDDDDDGDGTIDANDCAPLDGSKAIDTDNDGICDVDDDDDDNDLWTDLEEADCGTDPLDGNSIPVDSDGDGICDALDLDDDGDGYINSQDAFPSDPTEWNNTDASCTTECIADAIGDNQDTDDDGDGVLDTNDAFPRDYTESVDTDGDGIGNNADTDDDDDDSSDSTEIACGSDPLDENSIPADYDNDGLCDVLDDDDDDDDSSDSTEIACGSDPLDESSIPTDTDNDGMCDALDDDDDEDGIIDANDCAPLDDSDWDDTDNDQICDGQDDDDDGDGVSDVNEIACSSNPKDNASLPLDSDSDGECDSTDGDDDGDGYDDGEDCAPLDSNDWLDTDNDDLCDSQDSDDDGDSWPDDIESNCGSDTLDSNSIPADLDNDGMCDLQDPDDDGDGFGDAEDAFERDSTEWSDFDSDGTGDNADTDDDSDSWSDSDEDACGTNSLDSSSIPDDIDGDGICDSLDSDNTDGPDYVAPDETPGFGAILGTLAILSAMLVARRRIE